jgi:threonine aldolase
MFGGGMRQSGLLAAAAIFALERNVARLADDHANARELARGIAGIPGLRPIVAPDRVPTNMVFFDVDPGTCTGPELCERLARHGVRMIALDPQRVRAVTHLDVDAAGVARAVDALRAAVCG